MRGQGTLPIYGDYVSDAIYDIRKMSAGNKGNPLCLRFSGGKDSVVAKWLFEQAGVPFVARFSPTTVDAPELLAFIRQYHSDVIWDKVRTSMFKLIVKKGFPPTRIRRYCCQEFKERNSCGVGNITCTGVRKEESSRRRNRQKYEVCTAYRGVLFYHPVIDWTEEQIWQVIEDNHIPYCCLYDEGFSRIGCIGCPMASSKQMIREFRRWPKFEQAYMIAFRKMLEGRSFDRWKTAEDVMEWYIYGVQQRYAEMAAQDEANWQQERFWAMENELYYGDYYDSRPRDTGEISLEAAQILLEV